MAITPFTAICGSQYERRNQGGKAHVTFTTGQWRFQLALPISFTDADYTILAVDTTNNSDGTVRSFKTYSQLSDKANFILSENASVVVGWVAFGK